MCMKAIININITEIEGKSISIYARSETTETNNQMFGNVDNIYVKQAEVNDVLGYTCNTKSNFSGYMKCQDLSTRSYNFIPMCLVIDYLDSLPSTGERRKNSRTLESYITKITSIFRSSYNPINDIKGAFDATEPEEKRDNTDEVEALKKEIKEKEITINTQSEILANAFFLILRISSMNKSISMGIDEFFTENKQKEAESHESC